MAEPKNGEIFFTKSTSVCLSPDSHLMGQINTLVNQGAVVGFSTAHHQTHL